MDHVFACGFNGFQQVQEMENLLKSITNFKNNTPNSHDSAESLSEEPSAKIKVTGTWKDSIHSDGLEACQSKCVCSRNRNHNQLDYQACSVQGITTSKCFTRKRKSGETQKSKQQCVDGSVNMEHFPAKADNKNVFILRTVGTLSSRIRLERADLSWARIGLTVSITTGASSEGLSEEHHTLVCGFHGDQQQSTESLQLHITDCWIRSGGNVGLLMQQGEQLLLLREGASQAELTAVVTGDSGESTAVVTGDSGESRNASMLESVSGTASEFVATYDKISVAKLSLAPKELDDSETGHSGVRLLLTCLDSGLSVLEVSCGLEHSLFLTRHGTVFSCGAGSRGQLGHGSLEGEEVPQVVAALEGVHCVCVSAGGWHSAAVTECGDLYMWGWNESGQLGLPSPGLQQAHHPSPQQHHQSQQPQQQSHQQGEGEEVKAASLHLWPQCVDVVDWCCTQTEEVVVVKVSCGSRHTGILTEKGEVFTTGWNKYGQLGLPHTDSTDRFLHLHLQGVPGTVTQLWCGAWNSLFVVKQVSLG